MKTAIGLVFCIAVLLPAPPARAQDAGQLMIQGSGQLQHGEWKAAEATFRRVLEMRPADPDALVLLGIAQYHQGAYSDAAASLEPATATPGKSRYESRALYYLGMAYSQLGESDAAQKTYSRLLQSYPDSEEAARIRRLGPTHGEKTWSFLVLQSVGRDSNPIRGSRVADVNLATPGPDRVLLTFLSVSKRFRDDSWQVEGSAFRSDFAEVDYLDLVGATVGVKGRLGMSSNSAIRPLAELQRTWLEHKPFEVRTTAGFTWEHTGPWSYDALARFSVTDYQGQFASLDGTELEAGAGIARHGGPGSRFGSARLQLQVHDVSADTKYLGYVEGEGTLEVQLEPSRATRLTLGTGFSSRRYAEADPNFLTRRDDTIWSSQAQATTRIRNPLYVQLKAKFADSGSNVDRYTYEQTVLGGALILVF